MRIAVTMVRVPFIRGGAEILAEGLVKAIREAGHEVEEISMPFRFFPVSEVRRSMDVWESENFTHMNGYNLDLAICLSFPTFYLQHPNKVSWLIHQHRAVYDLWNTPYTEGLSQTNEGKALRKDIIERDTKAFMTFSKIFTIAKTVSERLQRFNNISSIPLYHPPKLADRFYTAPAEPYIFYPSRLEALKRQELLIEAMKYVQSPVLALLAGSGGRQAELQDTIYRLGLSQRVRLMGRITDEEMLGFYAHSLGVFFGTYNEDYGYVTLEAMLAAKPVITCKDSGGTLEFVIDSETGFIVEPNPQAIAQAIDNLYFNQTRAAQMGKAGQARYYALDISWDNVLQKLLN